MIGIIGGTALGTLRGKEVIKVQTDYEPTSFSSGKIGDISVIFIPRHGPDHELPPHRVNHHANISVLHRMGIKRVIGVSLVGSTKSYIKPGSIVIPDQEVDFTGQAWTFFDGEEGIKHSDMTDPFCPRIRTCLIEAAHELKIEVVDEGTYVCMTGPQFETRAEIEFFAKMGWSVVGMTAAPEAKLCRDLGICYATICPVSNLAAGLGPGKITHEENKAIAETMERQLTELIRHALPKIDSFGDCGNCQS